MCLGPCQAAGSQLQLTEHVKAATIFSDKFAYEMTLVWGIRMYMAPPSVHLWPKKKHFHHVTVNVDL